MKSLLLDVRENILKLTDIPTVGNDGIPSLDVMHSLIGCDCIDIVMRTVGDAELLVVLDDEGLLKPDPIPALVRDGYPDIFGSVLLFGVGDDGDLTDISDDEVNEVLENAAMVMLETNDRLRVVVIE
jgi:hypothetical protein